MQTSDIIKPIWNKIGSIIPWRKGEADRTVESPVPATMIGAVIGKTIDISYQVERDGRTYFSDIFNLTIGLIPADKLTTPQITQATGGSLDVRALQGDASITVDAWPFIAVGQKMWMRLEGSSNLDLPDWQGYEISSPGAQATTVSKDDYLINLTDGSTLRLILEVSFDGGLTRQAFPVSELSVKNVPEPTELFEDFTQYGYIYMTSNIPQKFIGMTATSAQAAVTNGPMNGVLKHGLFAEFYAPYGLVLTLTFDHPCSYISFTDELNGYEEGYDNWRVTVFDTEGKSIRSWIPDSSTNRNITHPGIARLEASTLFKPCFKCML